MPTLTVPTGDIGAHNFTLTANTVTTVTFADDLDVIEVFNISGTDLIYYTLDGRTPTVGGTGCYCLPSGGGNTHQPPTSGPTSVKLISAGTPVMLVQRSSFGTG